MKAQRCGRTGELMLQSRAVLVSKDIPSVREKLVTNLFSSHFPV